MSCSKKGSVYTTSKNVRFTLYDEIKLGDLELPVRVAIHEHQPHLTLEDLKEIQEVMF